MEKTNHIQNGFTVLAAIIMLAACRPVTPAAIPPVATATVRPENTAQPSATPAPVTEPEKTPTLEATPVTTRTRPSDGMIMVNVPAGKFIMGSDTGEEDERPVREVHLSDYWIDGTEVTNEMYAHCVAAGFCEPPMETSSYTRQRYFDLPRFADYPVIFVDWNMASAYCAWAGARLPTEAEWEKAAHGEAPHTFPWGNEWDVRTHKRLNFADRNNPEAASDLVADDGHRDTAPVGSYEAGSSPYGVYDLAGNVWEWVADWYDPLYYQNAPADNPSGPAEAPAVPMRVLRGGSWVAANENVFHTSNRNGLEPERFSESIGFRCAQ